MNPIIDLLQRTRGTVFINEDGLEDRFELMPPLTAQELASFEAGLPCRLPAEIRDLLEFARGFTGVLDGIDFSGLPYSFGAQEIFPSPISLAGDGYGNFWVVDLTSDSRSWGPIFYACHDAPVVVHQADDLLRFIQEAIRFGNKPWQSEIDDVHERMSRRVWRDNPGVLSLEQCLAADDPELRAFAQSLDATWQFIDLRNPQLGDGFSWGRYGAKTPVKRCGEKRIFAYQKKRNKSLGARFLDAFR